MRALRCAMTIDRQQSVRELETVVNRLISSLRFSVPDCVRVQQEFIIIIIRLGRYTWKTNPTRLTVIPLAAYINGTMRGVSLHQY